MSEVIVLATVTPLPGHEAEVEEAFRALLEPTHGEDGCLLYALHRVAERPGQMVFIERWASREHLRSHAGSAHIAAVQAAMRDRLAVPVEIVILDPLAGGDPAKGSLAAGG